METLTDRLLTLVEASEYLHYKPRYVYQLIHRGAIACYKPGGKAGKVFFKMADLQDYVTRGRRASVFELREKADEVLTGGKACI